MERGFGFVTHGCTHVPSALVGTRTTCSDPEFHKRERTLMGSLQTTAKDIATVLDNMRAGLMPQTLNTHRLGLKHPGCS